MSRYDKFGDYLDSQNEPFTIKFEKIEEIIGEKLSSSAYDHQAHWSNSDSHPLMKLVLSKNWKGRNLNLDSHEIDFYKSFESVLLRFVKKDMPPSMKANYQPIVIKTLLEKNKPFIASINEIKEKLSELNFDRPDFNVNGACDTVMKALSTYISNENDNVSFKEKPQLNEIPEILKICGQEIARWHIEKIIGREPTLWRVKPGDEESDWEYHDEFLKTNSIGVGWNMFGDLSEFETEEDANKYMEKIKPGFQSKASMTSISHKMSKKDLVVVTKAQQEIVDFGIIVSKYNFEEKGDGSYNHRRQVVWLNQGPILKKDLPEHTLGGSIPAAHEVHKLRKELLLNALIGKNTKNGLDVTPRTNHDDPEIMKVLKVFENTKNVILYGPPGTGKTRMANIVKDLLLQGNSTVETAYAESPTWKSVSARVLLENKCKPLGYKKIAEIASEKKLKPTEGKTPEETLRRDIKEDIDKNGLESIFIKSGDGIYGLNIPTTFLNAAKIILFAYNKPMHYEEISKRVLEADLVKTGGVTPNASLLQVMTQDIQKNGDYSIFKKIDSGTYSLRSSTNNSQNKVNPKIALCFPSNGGIEKIERHQKKISDDGYMYWGISDIKQIKEKDFPIAGYICEKQKIIAKVIIIDIIKTEGSEDEEIKEFTRHKVVLKIDHITLYKQPFDDKKLLKWEDQSVVDTKNMSNFTYVEELNNYSNVSNNNFRFVTFHPSFSYEDFLEGIRPVIKNEGEKNEAIGYKRQDGIFKEICASAEISNEKHLLIIDEINRGNISKIFGELITLIEDDKRGHSLDLAYSKKPFSVPENLYILGTMNTADKSLVQIDTALRRRFAFVEMMPNSELKEIVDVDGIPIKNLMDKLNEKIREKYRDKQIGHSYFMNITDLEKLHFVFLYKIIPLLQDYFYGDYDELHGVLGDNFISKTKKAIHKKIIDNPEDLKNALLIWLGINNKDKSDSNDNSSE